MDRDSIVEILEAIGARNVLPYGKNVQCSCFLAEWRRGHSSIVDSRPSMGVHINDDGPSKIHCFSCELGGTFETALQELHRLGGDDLTKILARANEIEALDPEWIANSVGDYDEPVESYKERIIDESAIEPMMGRTHKYALEDRGFDIETLKVWGGGYDRKQRRIVFPVRKQDGTLVGMTGRAINWPDQKPKYFNYFEFDKGHYLFGAHLIRPGTKLILAEGLLDPPAVWQALNRANRLDEYSVVCGMGANITRHQQKLLVGLTDELTLFLDNDTAGWEGQRALARRIQRKIMLHVVNYPKPVGGDAAELLKEGVDIMPMLDNASLYLVEEKYTQ